jgi:hypothetical protein
MPVVTRSGARATSEGEGAANEMSRDRSPSTSSMSGLVLEEEEDDEGEDDNEEEDEGEDYNEEEDEADSLRRELAETRARAEEVEYEVRAELVDEMDKMLVRFAAEKKEAIKEAVEIERAYWEQKMKQSNERIRVLEERIEAMEQQKQQQQFGGRRRSFGL